MPMGGEGITFKEPLPKKHRNKKLYEKLISSSRANTNGSIKSN